MERVTREGPDEPLELNVKGSTGATGVICPEHGPGFAVQGERRQDGSGRAQGRRPGRARRTAGSVPIDPGDERRGARAGARRALVRASRHATSCPGAVLVAQERPARLSKGVRLRRSRQQDRQHHRHSLQSRIDQQEVHRDRRRAARRRRKARHHRHARRAHSRTIRRRCSRPATVAQLLGHTAGLADFFGDEFARTAKDRFRSNADYFALVSRAAAAVRAGRAQPVLQRLLHHAGCYHRARFRHAVRALRRRAHLHAAPA